MGYNKLGESCASVIIRVFDDESAKLIDDAMVSKKTAVIVRFINQDTKQAVCKKVSDTLGDKLAGILRFGSEFESLPYARLNTDVKACLSDLESQTVTHVLFTWFGDKKETDKPGLIDVAYTLHTLYPKNESAITAIDAIKKDLASLTHGDDGLRLVLVESDKSGNKPKTTGFKLEF